MAGQGLGPLAPMGGDPQGYAATKLGKSGPTPLEVGFARQKIELDLGKQLAAQKAAEAKNKVAEDKLEAEKVKEFQLKPEVVFAPHQYEYARKFKEYSGLMTEVIQANNGKVPSIGTPEYERLMTGRLELLQLAENSKQVKDDFFAKKALLDADEDAYMPGAGDMLYKTASDPQGLYTGIQTRNLDSFFDLDKGLDAVSATVAGSKQSSAKPNPDGTVRTYTREFVPDDKLLEAAVSAAAMPNMAGPLQIRWDYMLRNDPNGAEEVNRLAKELGVTTPVAIAFKQMKGKRDYERTTSGLTTPNEGGSGRADKAASARELLETGFGITGGIAQGRKVRDVVLADEAEITDFIEKYPKVLDKARFDIGTDEVITNYNNLYYDTQVLGDGKKIPAKVRGIVRDKSDGSVRVIYSTDAKGTDATVTEKIPKKEFYSKVIRRIALNTPEYDINTLDRIAQDEYKLIEGSGGQIDLPERGKKPAYGTQTSSGKKKAY